jgi:hypothetical protein
MLSPNTALGHGGSVIFMSECQVNYITRVLLDYWNMTHRPDLADYSATFRAPHNA